MQTNVIHTGDSAEVLKSFPDGCIDLTVTSPPYDTLRQYNGYKYEFYEVATYLYHATKKGGVVVWIVSDETLDGSESGTSFENALYFMSLGFKLHDTMIWRKTKMPQNHRRYEQSFEYMFVFSKGKPKTFNGIRDKKNTTAGDWAHASYRDKDGLVKKTSSYMKTKIAEYGLRDNIWNINPVLSKKERLGHPAPFPEELARDHILTWSNEGDVVLDCFSGSGTTLKMAKLLNRHYIGIDTSVEYVALANERLAQSKRGLTQRPEDGGNVAVQNELFG